MMTAGRVGAASSSYGDGDNWMVTGGTLNGTTLNTSEIYDASKNKWREGPPLPIQLAQHCQVQVFGEVIVTGKFLINQMQHS